MFENVCSYIIMHSFACQPINDCFIPYATLCPSPLHALYAACCVHKMRAKREDASYKSSSLILTSFILTDLSLNYFALSITSGSFNSDTFCPVWHLQFKICRLISLRILSELVILTRQDRIQNDAHNGGHRKSRQGNGDASECQIDS